MENFLLKFSIQINDRIYLKNPNSSELGKKIVSGSIDLIAEIGFEEFTFRKLAHEINSTEASIYRYFESKHKVLLFLTSWYWGWLEYKLEFLLANIACPRERLERAITLLTSATENSYNELNINEQKLYKIIISESSKAYLTKEVDAENKEGAFAGYKQLVSKVGDIILEINPGYKYPQMLLSTAIEGALHQRYFSEHLPRLTNKIDGKKDTITEFYKEIVFKAIKPN